MIFVCLGTQTFQFDRLTRQLDLLIEQGNIKDRIFAQIGHAAYLPHNYDYKMFLDKEEFNRYQSKADLIISHGGTGALISASKLGKNIIAVPRLSRFGEHVDDHQLQIVNVLENEGYIRAVYDIEDLGNVLIEALNNPISKVYNRESNVLKIITDYIDNL